jgi:hypothetical protein
MALNLPQINDIKTLEAALSKLKHSEETIPFIGTFFQREFSRKGIYPVPLERGAVNSFRASGNLELRFAGKYNFHGLHANEYAQELTGGQDQEIEFSHTFFTDNSWRLYEGNNSGDMIASSRIVLKDAGFENMPFLWTNVVELARILPKTGSLQDIPLKRYNVGQVRIYTEIPEGL